MKKTYFIYWKYNNTEGNQVITIDKKIKTWEDLLKVKKSIANFHSDLNINYENITIKSLTLL